MNKFFMWICHIIAKIATEIWWPFWSNIRWRKAIRNNIGVNEEDKVNSISDIHSLVNRLYSKFEWTRDGIDQLGDSICPPPQNYQHYLDGKLEDDCDGFHSLVLHCLYNSGIECYLFSLNAWKAGHCLLIFKYDNKWHINDYVRVCKGYTNIQDAIDIYVKEFPELYNGKSEVFYYGLTEYNYDTGKFKHKNLENLK